MAQLPVAVGETLDGKYRIERVLGQGGMGVVVAATQLNLDKPVAIKFLLTDLATDAELVERFLREARTLAKLENCENVARVIDTGQMGSGASYIVMEYLEGQDLARIARTRRPLGVAEVAGWVCEACEGIAAAHAVQIVHRDLKPANLFLAHRANERMIIKVLDFGISKALAGSPQDQFALTKTAAMLGSPLYMAPEQIQASRDADVRTDIWALGVILYELMTDRSPFLADSLGNLVHTILHEDPVPPHVVRPEVPPELSAIILKCLSKNREERWLSANDLGHALRPFGPSMSTTGPRGNVSSLATTTGPGASPPLGSPPPGSPPPGTPLPGTQKLEPAASDPPAAEASVPPRVGERSGKNDTSWGATQPHLARPGAKRAVIALAGAAVAGAIVLAFVIGKKGSGDTEGLTRPATSPSEKMELIAPSANVGPIPSALVIVDAAPPTTSASAVPAIVASAAPTTHPSPPPTKVPVPTARNTVTPSATVSAPPAVTPTGAVSTPPRFGPQ